MRPDEPRQEVAETAALYVAGALPDDERVRFERDMARDPAIAAQVGALSPVAELLAQSASPVPPPAGVRSSLMARVAADQPAAIESPSPQVWKNWPTIAETGDLYVQRAEEGSWDSAGVAGVEVRRLFVDREHNRVTMLVRMAPGSSYPRHIHDAAEECLVLEGDLHVGDTVLRRGDYQRAPAGSHHGIQSTEGGCLLLITSSLSDEIY